MLLLPFRRPSRFYRLTILPFLRAIQFCHFIQFSAPTVALPSIDPPINRPINHSVCESVDEATNASKNQYPNRAMSQRTNQ